MKNKTNLNLFGSIPAKKINENCFLCRPDDDLVYKRNATGLALCGLGPVVKGYSVVATRQHIRSACDALDHEPNFLFFAKDIREKLTELFGSCLITEHGRVPVCEDVSGTTDPHCYHAHYLMFPACPNIEVQAQKYFAITEYTSSLEDALILAKAHKEYFLLSPKADQFLIMTRPGKLIRQFSRMLVAESIGKPELTNWRLHPLREASVKTSFELQNVFGIEENKNG